MIRFAAGRRELSIATLMAALLVAGCIPNQGPPSVAIPPPAATPVVAVTPPPAPAQAPPTLTVRSGDTLYRIAQREGVPPRALIDANGLVPPYALQPGQVLKRPEQRFYAVQPGDTLAGVSRRFGVDMSTLVQLNGLAPPYGIQRGQLLKLPSPVEGGASTTPVVQPTPLPEQRALAVMAPSIPPPAAGPVSMETETAAPRTGIVAVPLTPLPSMSAPASVAAPAAQVVPSGSLPPLAPSAAASQPNPPPFLQAPAPQAAPHAPAVTTAPAAEPVAKPRPAVTDASASAGPTRRIAKGPIPEPPPRAGRTFLWPVKGTVLASFGPQPGGLHNDGINIGAPAGTPVKAVDNGVVAYAGNELRGFGNLLLIKHSGGWVSAYAHNERLLVKRGEEVKRGQVIARVGATGSVTQPQVHFQLRRGQHAVDPRPYLEQGQAEAPVVPPNRG